MGHAALLRKGRETKDVVESNSLCFSELHEFGIVFFAVCSRTMEKKKLFCMSWQAKVLYGAPSLAGFFFSHNADSGRGYIRAEKQAK